MDKYICVHPTCDVGFKCKFQDVASVVACSEWHVPAQYQSFDKKKALQ